MCLKGIQSDREFEKKYRKKLAEIYFEIGKYEDAKQMILSTKSNDMTSLMNLGCIYYKFGDLKTALEKYQSALNLCRANDFNSEMYYNISLIYYELGNYEEALEYLEEIIQHAYQRYPQLKVYEGKSQVVDGDKKVASDILRETAIVEALNLKADIFYK